MLNPNGQAGIAWDDKDFSGTFEHLANLSTVKIFEFYEKYGGGKNPYSEGEMDQLSLVAADDEEDGLQDEFISIVYGDDSILNSSEWIAKVNEQQWAYRPLELRKKMLEKAGLEWKY